MKGRDTFKIIIVTIARILFGITFIFSGFVKAIDPLGFTYKIEDYLISFQLTEFIPLALSVAISLIVLELILGVSIILGLYRKWSSLFAVLFMVVMTPLTLYIALVNPVKDCGCFGDALIISNWNTFYKNIFLLVFAIILFIYNKLITPFFSNRTNPYAFVYVLLYFVAFCFYNLIYLPVLDFRPYKIGSNITEKMGQDMSHGDVYENLYVYEKEGSKKEFSEENFPWEDSSWTFVELKSKLIVEGDKPDIQDFAIVTYQKDAKGIYVKTEDITQKILSQPYSILAVSISLNNISDKKWNALLSLAKYAMNNSIDMQVVTASDAQVINNLDERIGDSSIKYASMDELTLKTIIRSNPGIVLLKKGEVEVKWSKNNMPDETKLKKIITQSQLGLRRSPNNNIASKLLIICLVLLLPLIGIKWCDMKSPNIYGIK